MYKYLESFNQFDVLVSRGSGSQSDPLRGSRSASGEEEEEEEEDILLGGKKPPPPSSLRQRQPRARTQRPLPRGLR
jgi:hypothetical protein